MGSTQQSIESFLLLEDIAERGYAEFEHNIPNEWVEKLIDAYTAFSLAYPDPSPETMSAMLPQTPTEADLENKDYQDDTGLFLPEKWLGCQLDVLERKQDDQQEWHKYRTNAEQVGKPEGYTNRTFQERAIKEQRGLIIPPEDPKEYYHFSPQHYANMARNHQVFGWGPIPKEVIDLERAFTPIHAKAVELVMRVCAIVEEVHPEIRSFISPEALGRSPLRLLSYHPTEEILLGGGHYDKSAMTLQIAESHRGLRVAPNSESEMYEVVRDAQTAVFFCGDAIQRHHDEKTPFIPAYHDITRTDTLNNGRSVPEAAAEICIRWALVFFASYDNYVQPSKASMHTR